MIVRFRTEVGHLTGYIYGAFRGQLFITTWRFLHVPVSSSYHVTLVIAYPKQFPTPLHQSCNHNQELLRLSMLCTT